MGGTLVAAPGGIPTEVPPKTLKEHRDTIIASFTNALDTCIKEAGENAEFTGKSPARFGAEVTFDFAGTTQQVKAHPALDFAAAPASAPVETPAEAAKPS